MESKESAWQCLKCGKALAILGEIEQGCGVYGLDKDSAKRVHTKNNCSYIICKFCDTKHSLIDNSRPGLPGMRLGNLIK